MKIYLKLLLAVLLAFALAMGCKKKDKAQLIAPQQAGERGASCQAKNDCGSNLSCIGGSCQPQNFSVEATGKECFIHECDTIADCCGDKPVDAPTKCRRRDSVCNSTVTGCPLGDYCESSDECGGGTCSGLYCENTFYSCATTASCEQDECEITNIGLGGAPTGFCTLSSVSCTDNADCTMTNECVGTGSCNCNNPNWDPNDPICTDPDCDDVCIYTCEEDRCVEDNSCEDDLDCPTIDAPLCGDSGDCVECLSDSDCDSTLDETDDEDVCRPEGFCETPCKAATECGAQQDCVEGDCVFVGCKTDRECILGSSFVVDGFGDRRLAVCDVGDDGIGQCKISCEIDNHCPVTQICQGGVCEHIGCDSDGECKALENLDNLVPTPDQPWNVTGVCQEPPAAE